MIVHYFEVVILQNELSVTLDYINTLGPQIDGWLQGMSINTWHTAPASTEMRDIVEDQEVIFHYVSHFCWRSRSDRTWMILSWYTRPYQQTRWWLPNPTACQTLAESTESYFAPRVCTFTSCSVEICCKMAIIVGYCQLLINNPTRFLRDQNKEIQRDFTRFSTTFEPNVHLHKTKILWKILLISTIGMNLSGRVEDILR